MTLELAAIAVVVFLLATAWLMAKDKVIKEEEEKFANVVTTKAEKEFRVGYVQPGDHIYYSGGKPILSVPPRKKQASRKRSKANRGRKKRGSK